MREKNLEMTYISYRKSYDLNTHSWPFKCLDLSGITTKVMCGGKKYCVGRKVKEHLTEKSWALQILEEGFSKRIAYLCSLSPISLWRRTSYFSTIKPQHFSCTTLGLLFIPERTFYGKGLDSLFIKRRIFHSESLSTLFFVLCMLALAW